MYNDFYINNFTIDPLNSYTDDPEKHFESVYKEYSFVKCYFTEATKNVSKRNIFQKLWDLIKEIFSYIAKAFKKIIDFITQLFGKNNKSTRDIFEETIGTIQKSNIDVKSIINNSNSGKIPSVSISIPKNNKSEINIDDKIELMLNPIYVKVIADRKEIIVNSNPMYANDNVEIKGHISARTPFRMNAVLTAMSSTDDKLKCVDDLCSAIYEINRLFEKNSNVNDAIEEVKNNDIYKLYFVIKRNENILNILYDNNIKSATYKMDNLINFNQYLQKASSDIASIDIEKFIENMKFIDNEQFTVKGTVINTRLIIDFINKIITYLNNLQMGINTLTAELMNIYKIPIEYIESIDDMENLSKIVESMIKNGIPTKYVMYNIYLAATKKLKGSTGNENAPIWGQSRVVFLPERENIVHKIAVNGYGLTSNVAEERVYNVFKSHGEDDLLAPVTWISKNKYCIDMVKADTSKINNTMLNSLLYKFKDVIQKINNDSNLNYKIKIGDIHSGNIGTLHNHGVLIDYGW